MTTERNELAIDLRAILSDLHPYRSYGDHHFSDELLALGVLLRREMEAALKQLSHLTKLPSAYADGIYPQLSVRPRGHQEIDE